MPFAIDWFTPFLRRRFWQIGKITLLDNPTCVLELRTALEPWPVIGDAGGSGTSRPVDNSMERLQLFLTGAVGDTPDAGTGAKRYVLCAMAIGCRYGLPGSPGTPLARSDFAPAYPC